MITAIEVPRGMVHSIRTSPEDMFGTEAPALHRANQAQWSEYLEKVYLAGYAAALRDLRAADLPSHEACTCRPVPDAVADALEITKGCPVHGG